MRTHNIFMVLLTSACLCFIACGGKGGLGKAQVGTPGGGGIGGGVSGFPVYITNSSAASVSAYLIAQGSGTLQRVTGSPFTTGGSSPDSLAFDSTKQFLLVANFASKNTSVFGVNATTAALTAVPGSPFAALANESRLAPNPSGLFVYALSSTPAQIDGYSFNSTTGALAALAGFPVSLNTSGETGLAISPNGSFLYASNPNTNQISSFTVAISGSLTALATTSATNGSPVFLTFDSSGRFLFAVNTSGGSTGGGSVSVFSVSSTGALTEVSGSPFAVGTTPVSAAFSNGVLYVVNQTSATLSALALNGTTGQLTAITGSPYQLGTRPVSVAPAVNGAFLVVTNSSSGTGGTISVFSVANDGTLTQVTGSPFTPDTATPDQVVAF
jgi:6-phosphogluconolactonase (cycloisomerase 2 family)